MKLNLSALTVALTLLALWGLRRLGMDAATADTITTALVVGLGLSRPAVQASPSSQVAS